ncbi:MAG: lipoprotein insertase outer membrane protein LolB [Agarilytica sp.]
MTKTFKYSLSYFCFSALIFLGGCAHAPATRIQHVDQIESFLLKGKLGIRTEQRAQALNFNWTQTPKSFDIKLYGTLGFGSVRIHNKNGLVELHTKKGIQTASDAESLLTANTGVQLPLSALESWVLGKASPTAPIAKQSLYPSGKLEQLSQLGWNIYFKQYQAVGNLTLPKKIIATQGSIRLTIAAKSWQI